MLIAAVRHARERANRAHADQVSVGGPVFAFLLPPAKAGGLGRPQQDTPAAPAP